MADAEGLFSTDGGAPFASSSQMNSARQLYQGPSYYHAGTYGGGVSSRRGPINAYITSGGRVLSSASDEMGGNSGDSAPAFFHSPSSSRLRSGGRPTTYGSAMAHGIGASREGSFTESAAPMSGNGDDQRQRGASAASSTATSLEDCHLSRKEDGGFTPHSDNTFFGSEYSTGVRSPDEGNDRLPHVPSDLRSADASFCSIKEERLRSPHSITAAPQRRLSHQGGVSMSQELGRFLGRSSMTFLASKGEESVLEMSTAEFGEILKSTMGAGGERQPVLSQHDMRGALSVNGNEDSMVLFGASSTSYNEKQHRMRSAAMSQVITSPLPPTISYGAAGCSPWYDFGMDSDADRSVGTPPHAANGNTVDDSPVNPAATVSCTRSRVPPLKQADLVLNGTHTPEVPFPSVLDTDVPTSSLSPSHRRRRLPGRASVPKLQVETLPCPADVVSRDGDQRSAFPPQREAAGMQPASAYHPGVELVPPPKEHFFVETPNAKSTAGVSSVASVTPSPWKGIHSVASSPLSRHTGTVLLLSTTAPSPTVLTTCTAPYSKAEDVSTNAAGVSLVPKDTTASPAATSQKSPPSSSIKEMEDEGETRDAPPQRQHGMPFTVAPPPLNEMRARRPFCRQRYLQTPATPLSTTRSSSTSFTSTICREVGGLTASKSTTSNGASSSQMQPRVRRPSNSLIMSANHNTVSPVVGNGGIRQKTATMPSQLHHTALRRGSPSKYLDFSVSGPSEVNAKNEDFVFQTTVLASLVSMPVQRCTSELHSLAEPANAGLSRSCPSIGPTAEAGEMMHPYIPQRSSSWSCHSQSAKEEPLEPSAGVVVMTTAGQVGHMKRQSERTLPRVEEEMERQAIIRARVRM